MRGFMLGAVMAVSAGPFAQPAAAHPHMFIDTGLQLLFDEDGQLAALRVVWVYDEFYSMFFIDDLGLDPEFTGNITEEERALLAGFDMNWDPDYDGDLYPLLDGQALALSRPLEWTADYREGRIITTHLRAFEERIAPGAAPLVIQVYDPTYYTAYTIATDPVIEGRDDCTAQIFEPDWSAAGARLEAALEEMFATGADSYDIEEDFPAVGHYFAEEVRLTCSGSS